MESTTKKYLSGKSSAEEQKQLLDWLRTGDNLSNFQSIKKEWITEISGNEIPEEIQPNWKNIQNSLLNEMHTEMQKTQRRLSFFRYAAILILLISIPSLVFFFAQPKLSDQLAYTTVTADFGQISKVVLPDSSVIWINSGSSIRYNNRFSATNRNIELTGEAFFKVHKNKNLPMIVSSENLKVKVLGTEFSMSAYPEESTIQVVLEKGKIELCTNSNIGVNQKMNPGELATFDKIKNELVLSNVNTELYTSWKDGLINIYNLSLSELVIKLEKRYNQKFVVDDEIKNLPYTFTIKNENLNSILNLMEKITPIDAVQQKNTIELKYNKNKKALKMK